MKPISRFTRRTLLFLAVTAISQSGLAQATAQLPSSPADLLSGLKDVKNQADLLNKGVAALTPAGSPLAFLEALKLHFKVFEATAVNSSAALGLDYDFDKAVTNAQVFGTDNPGFLTFSLKAKGSVAFARDRNPADFLQSGGQLHLWQYIGQTAEDPKDENGRTLSSRTFTELASDKYRGKSIQEIKASPAWTDYAAHAFDHDPGELFYDLAGNGALESNQSFSKKQWAYGIELHADYRAWKPDSAWSKFNLLDWPFAAARALGPEPLQPSGRALPGIMIGADLVDPAKNTDRLAVDPDKSQYQRIKAEVGFRTKVIQIDGTNVWFNASYRYFRETDASAAIRAANMDRQQYFSASLELPGHYTVIYSTGKLPFDLKSEQVWALGFKLEH